VATANKEIVAKHGAELLRIAEEHTVELLYEASVGGGIPIIAPMRQNLAANKVSALYAIINGTTNYILTNMAEEGLDFSAALERAQRLGYAEADPANDIEGIDAAYKLAILASIAFHTDVCFRDVFHEGISRIARRDFKYAQELGYAIKLLAIAKKDGDLIEVRVHPTFIPEDALLAKVSGVYNAIQLEGDLVGKMLFYGEGAGANPTSSAVIADVISIGRGIISGVGGRQQPRFDAVKVIKPISEIQTRYYLRMNVSDEPGVLAQISRVLGDHLISISSVIQKESDERTQSAEIVIMTHPARESAMQQALTRIEQLPVIRDIGNFIRVEG
jgi:homoserine dehydrogenase